MKTHKKILFEFNNEFEGGSGIESAWAIRVDNGYQLDNILFYAKNYSWLDIVAVEEVENELYVTGLIQENGHSTLRIMAKKKKFVSYIRDKLLEIGCTSELSNLPKMIAVDIPPEIDYRHIIDFINDNKEGYISDFQEACISSKHKSNN